MSVLESLMPDFDDEVAGLVLPRPVEERNTMEVSGLVDYSDDDMPALETGMPALEEVGMPFPQEAGKTDMPPLEDDGDGEADDEAEAEAEAEAEVEAEAEEDTEGEVEEHPLEKNPFETSVEINLCIYSLVFILGMVTAFIIAKASV